MLQKSATQTNIIAISLLDSFLKTADYSPQSLPIAQEEEAYSTISKIDFSETSPPQTEAGRIYNQRLRISFPNSDLDRSARLQKYLSAQAVKLTLCNGGVAYIGLNDYFQNTRLKIEANSNHKTTTITYTTVSLSPIGYATLEGLPYEIPVSFE